ncbi:MAG: LysE family transporter [Nitrospirae bacterium]|nr:LysE family transporter [Nitrospirota bacterium]
MHYTLFLIAAFCLGCLAAVPAGPVQIEVLRRSINGNLKASFMVVFGAFFADLSYGIIAFFGIAPFLENDRIMAVFWLAGGLILGLLGILSLLHGLKDQETVEAPAHLGRKRWAFLSGLTLSATNPVMVLWWLSGARVFKDVGLITELNTEIALSFLAAGSLGLASYLSALSLFIYWAKKFISAKALRRVNLFFGLLLILTALYFLYTSCHSLLHIC